MNFFILTFLNALSAFLSVFLSFFFSSVIRDTILNTYEKVLTLNNITVLIEIISVACSYVILFLYFYIVSYALFKYLKIKFALQNFIISNILILFPNILITGFSIWMIISSPVDSLGIGLGLAILGWICIPCYLHILVNGLVMYINRSNSLLQEE